MKIRIESSEDKVTLSDGKITAIKEGMVYKFPLSDVREILIKTSNGGPLSDDMRLVVRFIGETSLALMSQHACYENFLFEQLGKAFELDYNMIMKASSCVENNAFMLYKKAELESED